MSTNIWIAASDGNLDAVKQFLDSGHYSPNSPDPNGYTPMHAAAAYGHTDLLKYLVSKGGDVNVTDDDGDTPLHHTEQLATAQVLIGELGADYSAKDNDGLTPVQFLEQMGEAQDLITYLHSLEANGTDVETVQHTTLPNGENIRLSTSQIDPDNSPELAARREQIEKIMAEDISEEERDDKLRAIILGCLQEAEVQSGAQAPSEEPSAKRRK